MGEACEHLLSHGSFPLMIISLEKPQPPPKFQGPTIPPLQRSTTYIDSPGRKQSLLSLKPAWPLPKPAKDTYLLGAHTTPLLPSSSPPSCMAVATVFLNCNSPSIFGWPPAEDYRHEPLHCVHLPKEVIQEVSVSWTAEFHHNTCPPAS